MKILHKTMQDTGLTGLALQTHNEDRENMAFLVWGLVPSCCNQAELTAMPHAIITEQTELHVCRDCARDEHRTECSDARQCTPHCNSL
jgi:hypothetical protein